MSSLSEIFESSSDQARLLTTIIATIFAIVAVLLNQKFNSKRARSEKIIDKIEEIYSVISQMQILTTSFHETVIDNYEDKRIILKSYDELKLAQNKVYMLGELYFDSLIPYLDSIKGCHDKLYKNYELAPEIQGYIASYILNEDEVKLVYSYAYAYLELSSIMKKTMH